MESLTLKTVHKGRCTIVTLDGALNLHSARTIRDEVLEICSGYGTHVLIDLTALRFCDATGLSTLMAARTHAADMKGALALVGPQATVAKVLGVPGLDFYFDSFPRWRPQWAS